MARMRGAGRVKHARTFVVLAAYGLIAFLAVAEEPCVKIRVTNCFGRTVRMAHGPATLCAEVRVQQKPEHRHLIVTWDYADKSPLTDLLGELDPESPLADPEPLTGVVGSAEDDLDGASEPILIRPAGFKLESLSGGTYDVVARVYRDVSKKKLCGMARTTVMVR